MNRILVGISTRSKLVQGTIVICALIANVLQIEQRTTNTQQLLTARIGKGKGVKQNGEAGRHSCKEFSIIRFFTLPF
jgi:hypothetical protein